MKELTPKEAADKLARSLKDKAATAIAPIPKPGPTPEHDTPLMKQAREGVTVGKPGPEWKNLTIPVNGTLAGRFEIRPLGDVIPREDNPRHINEKAPKFLSLVESVSGPLGVVTPGIARPHPKLPGKLELLAGHRRHRAAGVCGLAEFPVVVRDLNDHDALLLLVFENMDREDLTPLEEARGVRLLLEKGFEAAEISARMKKPVSWIARRSQLLQLTPKWKDWAEEWNIGAAHLELIARLDRELQEELFDALTEDEYVTQEVFFQPGSLRQLRERINEDLRELKLAPWALDNAVLCPKAGACSDCPKRSGCQPDLFSDPEDAGDRCLDPECWKDKMATFKKQREADLRKEHPGLVLIEGKGGWQKGALASWQFTECKKSAEGAVAALIVCGAGEGSLTWVKLKEGRGSGTREQAAKPAKETAADKQAAASLDPAESARLLAEKQEAHEKRRWAAVADQLQKALDESNLPVAEEFRTAEGLLRLVRVFSTDSLNSQALWMSERERTWEKVNRAFGIETLEAVWEQLRPRIRATLEVYKVGDIGPDIHAAIKGVAMLLGRDVAELKQAADEAIKEPKSWEQLRKLAEAPPPAKEKPEQKPAKVTKKKPNDAPEERAPGGDRRPWSERGLDCWQQEFSKGLTRIQLIQGVANLTDAERLQWAQWVTECGNEDETAVLDSFYDSGITNLRRARPAKKVAKKKGPEAA